MAPSPFPYITTHSHGHINIHYVKPTPTPYPTAKCIKYASFMHKLPVGWALFLALVFTVIAVLSTNAVRRWTPGVCDAAGDGGGGDGKAGGRKGAETMSQSRGGEASSMEDGGAGVFLVGGDEEDRDIDGDGVGGEGGIEIPPPPYQAPASASASVPAATSTSSTIPQTPKSQTESGSGSGTSNTEASEPNSWLTPKKPEIEYTSAHLFVIGTSLLLLNIISLTISALCIQAACFCGPDGEFSILAKTFLWLLFSLPAGWASTALSCWLMLLRDLWGKGSWVRGVKIQQATVALGVFMVLALPLFFVGYVVGGGAVWCVQWCQRVCCGGAGEGDGEFEEGRGEGVELDEHGEGDGEEEERVALIGNGSGHGSKKGEV